MWGLTGDYGINTCIVSEGKQIQIINDLLFKLVYKTFKNFVISRKSKAQQTVDDQFKHIIIEL